MMLAGPRRSFDHSLLLFDFARWVPAFTTCLMCGLRSPEKHDLAQELREAAGSDLNIQGEGAGLSVEEIVLPDDSPTAELLSEQA